MAITAYRLGTNKQKYRATILEDNPVAYWRLGDVSGTTAADEKGSYPGTYVGSPTLGVAGAVGGNAAITTASGKYVSIASNSAIKPAFPFTIECWLKFSSSASFRIPVATGQWGSNRYGTNIQISAGNVISVNVGNGGPFSVTTSRKSYAANSATSAGNWHHVAAAWADISTCKLFIDGSEVATTASGTATTLVNDANPFYIGGESSNSFPYDDSIDEVAIYPTALSASRILAHYQAAI